MDKFYSNDKAVMERTIDISAKVAESSANLSEKYSLEQCCTWIQSNDFRKVCLQFPDHLLQDSVGVSMNLQDASGRQIYIMADTSYESCCVDYVNAAHINADAVIHYGRSCLSKQSNKIPTLFIHEKLSLDVDKCAEALKTFLASQDGDFTIVIDNIYFNNLDELQEKLKFIERCQIIRIGEIPSEKCIYVGKFDRKLTVFHLTYRTSSLFLYDDLHSSVVSYTQNQAVLKRRNFLVEKIKDAQTIAICIGTLAISNYLSAIERAKSLCKLHGKKYYTISVGKINVAKLANFPEMDVYVLISCAMNDIFDSRDFYKPIVTCYDLELALNPSITSDTTFTYNFTLPNVTAVPEKLSLLTGGLPDVSLLTGGIRGGSTNDIDSSSDRTEVALTGDRSIAVAGGDGFNRSWRGLEKGSGEDLEVKLAEDGRSGVAMGYENEQEKC